MKSAFTVALLASASAVALGHIHGDAHHRHAQMAKRHVEGLKERSTIPGPSRLERRSRAAKRQISDAEAAALLSGPHANATNATLPVSQVQVNASIPVAPVANTSTPVAAESAAPATDNATLALTNSSLPLTNATVPTNGTVEATRTVYNGTALWFNQTGDIGTCHVVNKDTDLIVGLSTEFISDFSAISPYCGSLVSVTAPSTNRSIIATVADASNKEYTTLSIAAFEALVGDLNIGQFNITYFWLSANETQAIVSGATANTTNTTNATTEAATLPSASTELPVPVETPVASPVAAVAAVASPETTSAAAPLPTSSAIDEAAVASQQAAAAASSSAQAQAQLAASSSAAQAAAASSSRAAEAAASSSRAAQAAASADSLAASSRQAAAASSSSAAAAAAASSRAAAQAQAGAASSSAAAAAAAASSSANARAARLASSSQAAAAAAAASSSQAAAAAAAASSSSSSSSGSGGNWYTGGKGTYYMQNGVAGNCGTVAAESDYVIAIDTRMYAGGSNCGRRIEAVRTDNGNTVVATMRDSCPTCETSTSLDFSYGAFITSGFATVSEGMVPIKWRFLD